MSLIGDIGGLISGFIADKKTNKLSKKQFERDKVLTDKQVDISGLMEQLISQISGKNYNFTDSYGGGTVYDPATGTYKAALNPQEKAIQDASYQEELARNTHDQALRRSGLDDFESMRKRSVGEATNALADINAFKRGIGRIDPNQVGSQLRADREGAVNAGYDDAAKAAQTLQLRTGNSAITDALAGLARDRSRTLATTMGDPELEGLQLAEGINTGRQNSLLDNYKTFGNEGRSFYDTNYTPSGYNAANLDRLGDANKFDLSKLDLILGGHSNAAGVIGNAQGKGQTAFQNFMGNRVSNPMGNLITGADAAVGDTIMNILKSIGGGG